MSAVIISSVFKMRVVLFYLCFYELGDRIQSQWQTWVASEV